jgi:hypothetical protein
MRRALGLSLNGPLGTSLNAVPKRPPPVRYGSKAQPKSPRKAPLKAPSKAPLKAPSKALPKNVSKAKPKVQPKPKPKTPPKVPKNNSNKISKAPQKRPPPVRRTLKSVELTPPSPQSEKSTPSPNVNYPGRNPLFKRVSRKEPYPTNPSGTRRFRRVRIVWADEPNTDFRNI